MCIRDRPGNGPGRGGNGNFILSGIKVGVAPAGKPDEAKPVEIASASASFQQDKYPASDALDGKPETGWAVLPAMGYPSLSLIHISEPTRLLSISYAVFCLK